MIVYLVRHGQTAHNQDGVFRGQLDVPLDDTGQHQAAAVGRALADRLGSDVPIISSPLTRATQTAEAVAAATGAKVEIDQCLTDMSFGQWEGQDRVTIASRYAELFRRWQHDPSGCRFPGGDDFDDFSERVRIAFDRVVHRPGDQVVVISHRVVLKWIICQSLGLGSTGFWSFRLDPASISIIDHRGRIPSLSLLNDCCHLGDRASRAIDF